MNREVLRIEQASRVLDAYGHVIGANLRAVRRPLDEACCCIDGHAYGEKVEGEGQLILVGIDGVHVVVVEQVLGGRGDRCRGDPRWIVDRVDGDVQRWSQSYRHWPCT